MVFSRRTSSLIEFNNSYPSEWIPDPSECQIVVTELWNDTFNFIAAFFLFVSRGSTLQVSI